MEPSIKPSVARRMLDLRKTFSCGQCFRWERMDENRYIGVVQGAVLDLTKEERNIHIVQYGENPLAKKVLDQYFDFEMNYTLANEDIVAQARKTGDNAVIRATKFCKGLRILRQDPFETLVSFMISANNNIPKIKLTIQDLCEKLGDPIVDWKGKTYHTFPTPEQIARHPEIVQSAKAIGYRARGIVEAAEKIASGSLDLSQYLAENSGFDEAMRTLTALYGVGEKVANCVLLFGLGHRNAFPVDTWVKKVLAQFYGVEKSYKTFIQAQFPVHPGLVQQYLFFYLRENPNQVQNDWGSKDTNSSQKQQ